MGVLRDSCASVFVNRVPFLMTLLGAGALVAAACGTATRMPDTRPPETQACPRLESRLLQLSRSSDPAGFAAGAGLDLNSSGVRVVIELAAGADLPARDDVFVEARYANLVQARVPLAQLCSLALETSVVSVASPARGVPQLP